MRRVNTPEGLVAVYSQAADGNMSLTAGPAAASLQNRRTFCRDLGVNLDQMVVPVQVHGDAVVCVRDSDRGKGSLSVGTALADTDALICGHPGTACCVQTADCLPVFLYDPSSRSIGMVHAGWRSTRLQLAAKTVAAMRERFQARPSAILAWFGPALGPCCYQVGEEFAGYFPGDTARRGTSLYFDICGANRRQLLAAGLQPEHISGCGPCTACSPEGFFSYRRQAAAAGRMLSLIMLKPVD